METPLKKARREILRRLLEAYERSQSFGKPGPWRRDVLLRLDRRRFPSAFLPDGREELTALGAAAEELERSGAVRLVRHRGWAAGEPHEIRLGPGELEAAYRTAQAEGFEPLAEGLEALAEHAARLIAPELPEWFGGFLERVRAGALNADLSPLGMQRERFKREKRDVVAALSAAAALARGASGWERVVSERLFGDSKRLGAVRSRVVEFLIRTDPRWEGLAPEDSADLLEVYGLRRKPGIIRCAGKIELSITGRSYFLEDFSPTAHLPEAWNEALIDALSRASLSWFTSIENEYPFLSYVEQEGGPRGLGERGEFVLYTAGFPPLALLESFGALARRNPNLSFRHWGDADLGGLRIWWLLRSHINRAVELFRTRAEWLEEAAGRGGMPLSAGERAGLERLRGQILGSPLASAPDVAGALLLVDALLRLGVKVEQERY